MESSKVLLVLRLSVRRRHLIRWKCRLYCALNYLASFQNISIYWSTWRAVVPWRSFDEQCRINTDRGACLVRSYSLRYWKPLLTTTRTEKFQLMANIWRTYSLLITVLCLPTASRNCKSKWNSFFMHPWKSDWKLVSQKRSEYEPDSAAKVTRIISTYIDEVDNYVCLECQVNLTGGPEKECSR